ncbi:MAG: hypothetical protein NTZ56_19675 [Acidobacteria bacterium]|nr:hypothetical protein [Acidobacteriota bacterium]
MLIPTSPRRPAAGLTVRLNRAVTTAAAIVINNLSFMLWFVIAYSAGHRTLLQLPPSRVSTEYWATAVAVVALWLVQGLVLTRWRSLVMVSLSLAAFVPLRVLLGGAWEAYAFYVPFSIAGSVFALAFGQLGRWLRARFLALRPPMPPALPA